MEVETGNSENAMLFIQQVLNKSRLSREDLENCVYSTLFLANEKMRFCIENPNHSDNEQLKCEARSLIKEIQRYENRNDFYDVMNNNSVIGQIKALQSYPEGLLDQESENMLVRWLKR